MSNLSRATFVSGENDEFTSQREPSMSSSEAAPKKQPLDARGNARHLIRLLQCSRCCHPLRTPVTLPCGRSACRGCLPDSQPRANISFLASPTRQYGIICPFSECGQLHASNDCQVNVVLLKFMEATFALVEKMKQLPELPLVNMTQAQIPLTYSPVDDFGKHHQESSPEFSSSGGRLAATFEYAQTGLLALERDLLYKSSTDPASEQTHDDEFFKQIKESIQTEMECHVCYSLMLDPITTPCGHTFCRKCLARILDHSSLCPECRRALFLPSSLTRQPSNKCITDLLNTICSDQISTRAEVSAAEDRVAEGGLNTPLFPCTLAFPGLRTYLHIFEPRYRLMIRRAIESDGRFGMLAYNRLYENQGHLGRVHFMEIGTMLQIERYQMLPDGRSFIECRGLHRFKVREHGLLDGYIIAKTEKVEDLSLAEEEEREAEEISTASPDAPNNEDLMIQLTRKSTSEIRDTLTDFIARARGNSARWFSNRLLDTYGEPPDDPAILPYWLAAVLPLVDEEKYRILPMTSVRERLKMAAKWVNRIESQRWYVRVFPSILCVVLLVTESFASQSKQRRTRSLASYPQGQPGLFSGRSRYRR